MRITSQIYHIPSTKRKGKYLQRELEYLVIPRYLYKDRRLSRLQIELLAFINTFTGHQFFFSNKHLAEMFCVSEKGVSKALLKCQELGYVSIKYRIKADGGKVRFIQKEEKSCPEGYHSISRNPTAVSDKDIKIKENDNENGLSKERHPTHPLWVGEVVSHYFEKYKAEVGEKHPSLKRKNSIKVMELIENNEWDLDLDNWKVVIDKWFSFDRDTDWNINHFLSGEIVTNRMYETIY